MRAILTMPPLTVAWFIFSEDGKPMGMVLQEGESPFPVVGERLVGEGDWTSAEIAEFEELRQVCAMRRFRVVVKNIERRAGTGP